MNKTMTFYIDETFLSNFTGKTSEFKNVDDFMETAFEELKDTDTSKEKFMELKNKVYKSYVRYYPKLPEIVTSETHSGYTFCNKGKGAFEVYVLDITHKQLETMAIKEGESHD